MFGVFRCRECLSLFEIELKILIYFQVRAKLLIMTQILFTFMWIEKRIRVTFGSLNMSFNDIHCNTQHEHSR